MTEEQRMTDQKKRKILLIVSFISICILYIVTEYLSSRDNVSYNRNSYVSQFLLPPESQEVVSGQVSKATDSSFNDNILNMNVKDLNVNINVSNITITVIKGEDIDTAIKVSYPNSVIKNSGRNVFVEMKDINKSTENIFFIESRCSTDKMAVHFQGNRGFVLNARQCCAIESTAQMNLDHNVYIFHSCSLDDDFLRLSPKFVEELFKYPNVYVVRLNTTEVFSNTPLEELDRKKLLENSNYPVEHTSDLVRLTLLWRFGGTYCDLDVVTIRSLNNLKTNWAGAQDPDTIANGVLNFEPDGVGHRMLQRALETVNHHYDPLDWSSNGPLLVTPIILQECRVLRVTDAIEHCNGNFTVFNSTVLYPIYYPGAGEFFDNNIGQRIVADIKSKQTYSVHIWNKMSREMVVTVGSQQAYGLLADEFCPLVYRSCGTRF